MRFGLERLIGFVLSWSGVGRHDLRMKQLHGKMSWFRPLAAHGSITMGEKSMALCIEGRLMPSYIHIRFLL